MGIRVHRLVTVVALLALLIAALGASVGGAAARSALSTRVGNIDVDAATIPELQAQMNARRLTSVRLVQFYLHRIEKLEPQLNAIITVNPRVLAEARAADAARRAGDNRPLLGIPVIVKDNIDTTGMPTTAGSYALEGSTPPDAFIVRRLKAAGAIIIAKANLSEWANFRSIPSSSGWSAIGGQTNMPYVLDRNPCGSSSGTAVAVAADLATVGVGTETDGSIVCPSGANALVGVKPTVGLASRSGIIPISAQQDTAGPMTRNVTDAAVVLGAMTGVDPTDPATLASAGNVHTNYRQFLDAGALRGARIGVWREGNFGFDPATDAIMEATIARLRSLGATVVDPTDIPGIDGAFFEAEFTALLYEFKHDIAGYLAHTGPGYPKTLQDLIDFNNEHPELELELFNQEIFLLAQDTGSLSDGAYLEARAYATTTARNGIDSVMAAHDLDAIIGPTNSPAWLTDLENGDAFLLGASSAAAVAGYASITVPAGYSDGLPVGVSFIGGQWDEPQLLALTYAWEQATDIRVPPEFRRTLGDDGARKGRGKGAAPERVPGLVRTR